MTKLEEFRSNANHIKAWNDFVETETGKLFVEVINEGVLRTVAMQPDDTPHGTAFHGGTTSGATQIYLLIRSLHAQAITEEERKKAQLQDQALRGLLPSQRAAFLKRTQPE